MSGGRRGWWWWSCAAIAAVTVAACTGSAPSGPAPSRPSSEASSSSPQEPISLHGQVAFASDRGGNVDVYLLDVDSGAVSRLTTADGTDMSPTWSPDGTRIAFRSDRDGNDEVYVMDADGSHQRNLTRNLASDYSPAWSPDGRTIAFASSRADPRGNDVWLMDADGSNPRPLIEQEGIDEYPVWAPDSSLVAFNCTEGVILAQRVGDFEICVVGADGSGLVSVTDARGISAASDWSSDGERILFTSSRDDNPGDVSACGDIFVMDADGSNVQHVTDDDAIDCHPVYGPGDRVIVFASRGRDGDSDDLYVMNADGSNVRRLTDDPAEEQEAALRP